MNINEQAIQDFRETYLVSNTPLYLYKRLRCLPAVRDLASSVRGDELASEYHRRVNTKDRTPEDMAIAYACLAALTHKQPSEAISLFRSLDLSSLEWAPTIRALYFAKMTPERHYHITASTTRVPPVDLRSNGNSTSRSTELPKPKVQRKANL